MTEIKNEPANAVGATPPVPSPEVEGLVDNLILAARYRQWCRSHASRGIIRKADAEEVAARTALLSRFTLSPAPSDQGMIQRAREIAGTLVGYINEYAEAIRLHERYRLSSKPDAEHWENRWQSVAANIQAALRALQSPSTGDGGGDGRLPDGHGLSPSYQDRSAAWMGVAFANDPTDGPERRDRTTEELCEAYQADEGTLDDWIAIGRYTFGRPAGQLAKEFGQTMFTAACWAAHRGIDMTAEAERELARCSTPEFIEKLARKRATRHGRGPLPGFSGPETSDPGVAPTPAHESEGARDATHLEWAVSRWNAEVANRPLQNVHRRALDTAWRQMIRRFGGDPDALVGPSHDALATSPRPSQETSEGRDD